MYSNQPTFNNPFSSDPYNTQSRFPDISAGQSPPHGMASPGAGWQQQQQPGQQQSMMYQSPVYQQGQPSQQQPAYYNNAYPNNQSQGYGGYSSPSPSTMNSPNPVQSPGGFQPSSSFGQQLVAQAPIFGSSYSYLNAQNTGMPQHQQGGYNNTASQQTQNPSYISQFDPYAPLNSGWDGQSQTSSAQGGGYPGNSNTGAPQSQSQNQQAPSTTDVAHPRDFIRTHKTELESWDSYSWKQLTNSFESLANSWSARKKEIEGHLSQLQYQLRSGGGGYHPAQIQQEITRLEGLRKEADSNHDSVAASQFQMKELLEGYRQSSDIASKRRVREASNAALQALPDWPPQAY